MTRHNGVGDEEPCPCGQPATYGACCGRFHRGEAAPPTAERLMRSRYSAFVVEDADYLRRTWHPSTCPRRIDAGGGDSWVGLDVLDNAAGGFLDTEGEVEFRARRIGGDDVHERSTFVRVGRAWVYVGAAVS